MTERIKRLTELTLLGQMFVAPVSTDFDTDDEVDKLCKYIKNQEPKLTEYSAFTGNFLFDGSVIGDAFKRGGHKHTAKALEKYYLKPIENLSTMEWQHATADYKKVLEKGLVGIINDINFYLDVYKDEPKKVEFLRSLHKVALSLIAWADKCSKRVSSFALKVKNKEARLRLEKLSANIKR